MNMTNLEHALYALAMQVTVALVGLGWITGAFLGAGFFIGRELAQAEYRWIEQFGGGKRINMPWWGGFDPRVWRSLDCWMDMICPVLAVTTVALVMGVLHA